MEPLARASRLENSDDVPVEMMGYVFTREEWFDLELRELVLKALREPQGLNEA